MFKNLSLKMKMTIMSCSMIVIVVVASWVSLVKMSHSFEDNFLVQMESGANTLSAQIRAQFYERYGDVQAFALNNSVHSMNTNEMQTDLNDYVTLYGIYDLILVVDKNGHYVGSNQKDAAGVSVNQELLKAQSYEKEPWFKAVMNGEFTEDKETAFVGTYFESVQKDQLMKMAFGRDQLTTGFSAAIKNEKGEVVGVITNRANTKWFEGEFLSQFEALLALNLKEVEMYLMDGDGKILFKHVPFENNNKNEAVHDLNILTQQNLINELPEIKEIFNKKNSGAFKSFDGIHKKVDLQGYAKINGAKWIKSLSWHIVIADEADEVLAEVNNLKLMFYIVMFAVLLVSIVLVFGFSQKIGSAIMRVTQVLNEASQNVDKEASELTSSATKLSQSSTEQAAALQETVSAIEEISAMVGKNADNTDKSITVSQQSREASEQGRQAVENVRNSIDEINQANLQIAQQVDENGRQLTEIVQMIQEIGQKTKVINEIVFQTKLLSFNASVEAARAGEAGKGFAVVAEEVGNLAQMSGNASNEITALLDTSTKKVEQIVQETKTKIDHLMQMSQQKVEMGSQATLECQQSIEMIVENVQSVDALVSEIATASQEQSSGVHEISKSMSQMETVTQGNSSLANQTSSSAEELNELARNLKDIVKDLNDIVNGAA